MNNEKKLLMLHVKFLSVCKVLQHWQNWYCEQDTESMPDAKYLSFGNVLKKLNEHKDNINEVFEELINGTPEGTKIHKDLIDIIVENIYHKYDKKVSMNIIFDMLFEDMKTITTNIMPFTSHEYEIIYSNFNPLTQEDTVV